MTSLPQPPMLAPGQRIVATAAGATLLTYSLSSNPSVLTVSPPDASSSNAVLTLVATNVSSKTVTVSNITLAIPCGDGTGENGDNEVIALIDAGNAGGSGPNTPNTGWSFSLTTPPASSGNSDAVFTLQSQSGAPISVAPGDVIMAQLETLTINEAIGAAVLTITESTLNQDDQPQSSTIDFAVVKYPLGFYLDSLTVNVSDGASLTPVAQVAAGTDVVLAWNGSDTSPANYTVYYSSASGQGSAPLQGSASEWSSSAAGVTLTCDTVFTVVLNTTVGTATVPCSLTAAVSVQNPDLVANSLMVGASGSAQPGVIGAIGISTDTLSCANITAGEINMSTYGTDSGQINGLGATFTGAVSLNGPASFGGSVSVLGGPQSLNWGTYSCDTDCLLVLYLGPVWQGSVLQDNSLYVSIQVADYPNRGWSAGNVMWVTAGSVMYDDDEDPAPLHGNATVAIPANTQFALTPLSPGYPYNFLAVLVPLGAQASVTAMATPAEAAAVAEAEGRKLLARAGRTRKPRPVDADAVLDSLAAALQGPDGPAFKAKLAAILESAGG